ncbi:MAG: hypothetical protein ACREVE_17175 [Gammaproteobacteria bacterium]
MRLTALLTGTFLTLTLATAQADEPFSTLDGIDAEAMSAAEMDAIQGKFVGGLVAANLAFDQQFDQWAIQGVNDLYNSWQQWRVENNYWGPVNWGAPTTQDLINSNGELQQAYAAYNQSWLANQATSSELANQFSQYILGTGTFLDPTTGQSFVGWNGANPPLIDMGGGWFTPAIPQF